MSSIKNNEQVSPPHKKARGATGTNKSPHDLYFDELKAVLNRNNGIGNMLVRGIQGGDDEQEDDDTSKYTTEQMNSLRFIVITQARADAFDEMDKLILGDQYGSSFTMFNTSFSYHVFDSWPVLKQTLARKSWPDKFNTLLGFTNAIKDYDTWMTDREGGSGIELFLAYWKNVLKKSNQELGIDSEYTRPGIICFLERFKSIVEAIDTYGEPDIKFNFQ